jgi:hypothetical protein
MRCSNCEKAAESGATPATRAASAPAPAEDCCEQCGAPLDEQALSEFVGRLARFGLDARMQPLLGRFPRAFRRE